MININPKELYTFFEQKNIKYFFHANTIKTSCSMIMQGGLVSRGYLELHNLPMTQQSSDEKDKQVGVWNDIFIDIVDMHGYFPRQNFYGPVCFKISTEILLDDNLPNICITKNNPVYWEPRMMEEDKYYKSVEEYTVEFDENLRNKSIQTKMFTICHGDFIISFKKYLEEIILDNPRVLVNGINMFDNVKPVLEEALKENGYDIGLLKIRKCNNCYCLFNYLYKVKPDELRKNFLL